uniref:Potassium channel domain-containing protein n=1 Tax=Periophthalmus magnuspinnatus TaxID=409849 RepID=A0A3B4A986_9GOBI
FCLNSQLAKCSSLTPGRDSARFFLLGILIALYMLAGAAIFSFLERPFELQAHRLWTSRLKTFSEEHNISHAEIKSILYHYEEARTAGIRAQQGRALWDFPGAFYFVGTVVSTIGFGVSAPSTVTGKILLVFYGLLGCSATILFFNLFLERVITFLSVSLMWCCRGKSHHMTLVLLVAVLLVACCAALVYSVMEGWSYMESLYFCFVAFSTVGFGDFVSGQREQHEETRGYQVANCLLMLLGVCCTYSLFNAISVIIRQGLDWLLKCLDVMYHWVKYVKFRHFFRLCQKRSSMPTLHGSGYRKPWALEFPRDISQCFCNDAKVETVSGKDHKDRLFFKQYDEDDALSICTTRPT